MSATDVELAKMVRGFRVSDLQTLLTYAGRHKVGKKYELQHRALDLIKLRSEAIDMKIRELHHGRYNQSRGHTESRDILYPLGTINEPVGSNYGSRSSHQAALVSSGMPGYMPNLGKHMMVPPPHLGAISQYPVNPDVRLKDLPFYDVLAELLRPTSLVVLPSERFQEREFVFYFTPQHVAELLGSLDVQVQLRICVLDTTSEQDDEIPTSICLKINHKVYNLPNLIPTNKPGQEPKRPRRPLDITNYVKKTATEGNEVFVSWASSAAKPYVMGIYLVRKQNSTVLIRRLKSNGVRNPDHTTAMIKEKLSQDRDSEIATMSLRGSLTCPLGKIKMKLPCRALTCTHLQCFDATLYLQMNEKKPKWICPVCDKPAYFKNLAIDGLFLDITSKAPLECTEVQFHEDGSWTPVMPVKKQPEVSDAFEVTPKAVPKVDVVKPKKPVEVIDLDSDSDTEEDTWSFQPPKKKHKSSPNTTIKIGSHENSQDVEYVKEPFDPYIPGPSKSDVPSPKLLLPIIPEKASLPPLPATLEIDTEDDCILGTPMSNFPRFTGFKDVNDVSPKEFHSPSGSTFPESLNNFENTERTDFNLFSLLPDGDGSFSYPHEVDEERSPDIIDID